MTEQNKKTCGDHGGVKHNGEPCTRPAGWGTDENKGRCKNHQAEKVKEVKKEFIEILKDEVISISNAAEKAGTSVPTIHRLRDKDPEFDQRVREAKETQNSLRGERMKDSVFERVISGEASAALEIFTLKNITDWEDDPRVQVEQNQSQGQSQQMPENLEELVDEGVQIARQEDKNEDSRQAQKQQH